MSGSRKIVITVTQTCGPRATIGPRSNPLVLARPPLSSMECPLKIELVIFDCDGVLVDTEPAARVVLVTALESISVCAAGELADACVGKSLKDVRAFLATHAPATDDDCFWEEIVLQTELAIREVLKPEPSVRRVIRALGNKVCVASSGTHQKIRTSLTSAGLLSLFDGSIFSSEDVARGKPFPDLFLHAAACVGVSPRACCVIEDSAPGLQAAREAGMRSIHYAPEGGSSHEFVATAFSELPALIESIR